MTFHPCRRIGTVELMSKISSVADQINLLSKLEGKLSSEPAEADGQMPKIIYMYSISFPSTTLYPRPFPHLPIAVSDIKTPFNILFFFTICPTKLETISSNNLTKKKKRQGRRGAESSLPTYSQLKGRKGKKLKRKTKKPRTRKKDGISQARPAGAVAVSSNGVCAKHSAGRMQMLMIEDNSWCS